MIDWSDELINSIARRRCVIMIGSGVSKNSINLDGKRPASWEEFLRTCSTQIQKPPHVEDLIDKKDYLTACEILKNRLTPDHFITLVQQEYQGSGYRHAAIHEHIYNLDASIVASPNFDNIYDTYASNVSAGSIVIKNHTSQDIANYLLGGDVRLIIKTHGSANDPQKLIFTRNDYAEARTKYVLFYEILKSLVLTHTFLFVGCGIDDPDIRMLFEDVQFAHGRMPFHYMTYPKGSVHKDVLQLASESMRVKFLEYSPDNYHEELTKSIESLVTKVEECREEKRKNLKW
jgi:hypothetical protein